MAKINIPFDNTNYTIDESSFSDAAAELQRHLSSVMNGSGATINFEGVSYNIDSAKLQSATNAFISHLGTVSGNGTKVVVNGVAYNVDTTKVQDAIADLHTVLGGLQSGGGSTDSEMEVVFAEQTLDFNVQSGIGRVELFPSPFVLVDGETYKVVLDGNEYECLCEESDGMMAISHGEPNEDSTFEIMYAPSELTGMDSDIAAINIVAGSPNEGGTEQHTIAIYKNLSDSDSTG